MLVPEQVRRDDKNAVAKLNEVYKQYWLLKKLKEAMQNTVAKLTEVFADGLWTAADSHLELFLNLNRNSKWLLQY
jgi:hypothetical protein